MIADCCQIHGPQGKQQAVATIAPIPTTTVTWTITGAGKADPNSEEGWTLLPNGEFLTVDTENGTHAEVFNPSTNFWSSAGNTPISLPNVIKAGDVPEIGPGVMTGYELVVQFGANSNTAVFTPSTHAWTAGPTFPSSQEVADGPAALLPNGNIRVQTGVGYAAPSLFWEFGGETLAHPGAGTLTPVANPPCNDVSMTKTSAFEGRMLVLPTGQILWDAGQGHKNCTSVYTPNSKDGSVVANANDEPLKWFPTLSNISTKKLVRGNTYTLQGTVFKGVSQGAMYGDDAQMATNYPMVRITNNATGHVCYGRTHDFSTGKSTQFDVPPAVTPAAGWALVENPCDTGPSTLVVLTNGLASKGSFAVTIQ